MFEPGEVSPEDVLSLKNCSQETIKKLANRIGSSVRKRMGGSQKKNTEQLSGDGIDAEVEPKILPASLPEEKKDEKREMKNSISTRKALLILFLIFSVSLFCLSLVYYNFPKLDPSERLQLRLPKNIDDAKGLGRLLSRYTVKYYFTVLSGYLVTFIFLQSFAIPGSIFLSILSGFLFSFPLAIFLVCLCSSIGASICYLLSYLVGRRLVMKYMPDKACEWSSQVSKHRSNLLNYIIFLRITPFLPNWFINITSPVIDVPFGPFFFGTFFGVAPPSFVFIQAGKTLNKLTSSKDVFSWTSVLLLIIFACLSLIPVLLKAKIGQRFNIIGGK